MNCDYLEFYRDFLFQKACIRTWEGRDTTRPWGVKQGGRAQGGNKKKRKDEENKNEGDAGTGTEGK